IRERTSNSDHRTTRKFVCTGTVANALVISFDSAVPRQRSKSPREQWFAAVVSDGDHFLQPAPLVLAARVEQMDWHHHSVFQHPIDVRLAVSRALLDVHVGQAEAVEEDYG